MNILVIAPHPDDEAIACGGTICKHARKGDRIVAVFLTSGELGLKQFAREKAWSIREKEARQAAKILGIAGTVFLRGPDWMIGSHVAKVAKSLRAVLRQEKPEIIYLPHEREWHPDHAAALRIVRAALKGSGIGAPALRGYEVWTPLTKFDHVEDITSVMPRKLRALRAHRSQLTQFDYARAVRGLNEYRGALAAKSRYAEVFQTIGLKT